MAHTFSQVYLQFVFSVKNRSCFLKTKDTELHKYIAGIIKFLKSKPIIINNMPDHIHIFLSKHPSISEAELAQKIKNNSSRWLKSHLKNPNFAWQTGYGVFSYGQSQTNNVFQYIQNQQIRHKSQTFRTEYKKLLELFEIEYDNEFLFDFFD